MLSDQKLLRNVQKNLPNPSLNPVVECKAQIKTITAQMAALTMFTSTLFVNFIT